MAKKSFFKQSANVSANSTTTTLEISKPTKFLKNGNHQESKIIRPAEWGKWFVGALLGIIGLGLLLAVGIGWWYARSFEAASGEKLSALAGQLRNSQLADKDDNDGDLNFLILGLDQSENQRETSLLTDTMILARYSKQNEKLSLFSLPRDLWIDSLKTKINALYYYGEQDEAGGGIALVNSVVSEISGDKVDYYAVINMDSLKQVIDAIGGIEVEIERSFEDKMYPREIDLSSTDPTVLYETVAFTKGKELMSGERALKYIRSRHSQDEFEGTDEGRERRQQVLLAALKMRIVDPKTLSNPKLMGNLYRVWKSEFKSNIDEAVLLSLIRNAGMTMPEIQTKTIPVQDSSNSGLIFHPQKGPANQWVYLPVDPSWQEIRKWFSQ